MNPYISCTSESEEEIDGEKMALITDICEVTDR